MFATSPKLEPAAGTGLGFSIDLVGVALAALHLDHRGLSLDLAKRVGLEFFELAPRSAEPFEGVFEPNGLLGALLDVGKQGGAI